MEKGRCHSLDSPLGAKLGLASYSLTSFSSHRRCIDRRCRCKCSTPISDATATIPEAEAKCSIVVNTTADEPAKCVAAATVEPTTSTSPDSATYTECTKPRKSRFGPLLQVWHEWSSHPTVSQQVVCSRSRRTATTSRTVELHLRQGQPRDY
jgi:hypothetical protein